MACAILLLAGAPCAKWGRPHALRPVEGDCLVNHLAVAAGVAGGAPVVRVLGAHALAVAARRSPAGVLDFFDRDWARGPGGGIAGGLRTALEEAGPDGLDAALILPCEPPLVSAAWLRRAVEAARSGPERIVQAGGVLGFGRAYFAELLALEGAADGRHIVNRHLRHRVTMPAESREAAVMPTPAGAAASAFVEVKAGPDLRPAASAG